MAVLILTFLTATRIFVIHVPRIVHIVSLMVQGNVMACAIKEPYTINLIKGAHLMRLQKYVIYAPPIATLVIIMAEGYVTQVAVIRILHSMPPL